MKILRDDQYESLITAAAQGSAIGFMAGLVEKLAEQVRAHDKWAKDYNVTVEARNQEVLERSRKQGEAHEVWLKGQIEAVTSVVEMFQQMRDKLEDIHVVLCQPKPAKKRKRAA
jgi:hypothetical protein